MKIKTLLLLLTVSLAARARERLIVVNEGLWQTDNGRLTYFADGEVVSNQWFRDINGFKLGDTPNDIIQVNDNLIAIAVNWSNIIQFIDSEGKAVGATEDVPNNRHLATDGKYVYVTSYAHEVGINGSTREFEKGYVAKIDAESRQVVDAVEVGYEPEGIAYYKGCLFVANSGGYAFQEDHDYESTVSVVDAETMEIVRNVDTGQINLYGSMSQSGQYLCINSPGDYYTEDSATIIFDCEAALEDKPDEECCVRLEYASTANCVNAEGNFYAIGSHFSYINGEYEFNYLVLKPGEIMDSMGENGVEFDFPGTVKEQIASMTMPYGIYVNPYSGYIYATDAGEYTGAGALYQWDAEGRFVGKYKTYINPGHFLALPEKKPGTSSVKNLATDTDETVYNLQGMPVNHPRKGDIYIMKGKKIIY